MAPVRNGLVLFAVLVIFVCLFAHCEAAHRGGPAVHIDLSASAGHCDPGPGDEHGHVGAHDAVNRVMDAGSAVDAPLVSSAARALVIHNGQIRGDVRRLRSGQERLLELCVARI